MPTELSNILRYPQRFCEMENRVIDFLFDRGRKEIMAEIGEQTTEIPAKCTMTVTLPAGLSNGNRSSATG